MTSNDYINDRKRNSRNLQQMSALKLIIEQQKMERWEKLQSRLQGVQLRRDARLKRQLGQQTQQTSHNSSQQPIRLDDEDLSRPNTIENIINTSESPPDLILVNDSGNLHIQALNDSSRDFSHESKPLTVNISVKLAVKNESSNRTTKKASKKAISDTTPHTEAYKHKKPQKKVNNDLNDDDIFEELKVELQLEQLTALRTGVLTNITTLHKNSLLSAINIQPESRNNRSLSISSSRSIYSIENLDSKAKPQQLSINKTTTESHRQRGTENPLNGFSLLSLRHQKLLVDVFSSIKLIYSRRPAVLAKSQHLQSLSIIISSLKSLESISGSDHGAIEAKTLIHEFKVPENLLIEEIYSYIHKMSGINVTMDSLSIDNLSLMSYLSRFRQRVHSYMESDVDCDVGSSGSSRSKYSIKPESKNESGVETNPLNALYLKLLAQNTTMYDKLYIIRLLLGPEVGILKSSDDLVVGVFNYPNSCYSDESQADSSSYCNPRMLIMRCVSILHETVVNIKQIEEGLNGDDSADLRTGLYLILSLGLGPILVDLIHILMEYSIKIIESFAKFDSKTVIAPRRNSSMANLCDSNEVSIGIHRCYEWYDWYYNRCGCELILLLEVLTVVLSHTLPSNMTNMSLKSGVDPVTSLRWYVYASGLITKVSPLFRLLKSTIKDQLMLVTAFLPLNVISSLVQTITTSNSSFDDTLTHRRCNDNIEVNDTGSKASKLSNRKIVNANKYSRKINKSDKSLSAEIHASKRVIEGQDTIIQPFEKIMYASLLFISSVTQYLRVPLSDSSTINCCRSYTYSVSRIPVYSYAKLTLSSSLSTIHHSPSQSSSIDTSPDIRRPITEGESSQNDEKHSGSKHYRQKEMLSFIRTNEIIPSLLELIARLTIQYNQFRQTRIRSNQHNAINDGNTDVTAMDKQSDWDKIKEIVKYVDLAVVKSKTVNLFDKNDAMKVDSDPDLAFEYSLIYLLTNTLHNLCDIVDIDVSLIQSISKEYQVLLTIVLGSIFETYITITTLAGQECNGNGNSNIIQRKGRNLPQEVTRKDEKVDQHIVNSLSESTLESKTSQVNLSTAMSSIVESKLPETATVSSLSSSNNANTSSKSKKPVKSNKTASVDKKYNESLLARGILEYLPEIEIMISKILILIGKCSLRCIDIQSVFNQSFHELSMYQSLTSIDSYTLCHELYHVLSSNIRNQSLLRCLCLYLPGKYFNADKYQHYLLPTLISMSLDCDHAILTIKHEISSNIITTYLSKLLRILEEQQRHYHISDSQISMTSTDHEVKEFDIEDKDQSHEDLNPDTCKSMYFNNIQFQILNSVKERLPTELWSLALQIFSSQHK